MKATAQLENVTKDVIFVRRFLFYHVTKRKYKRRGVFICNTKNVIYLTACKCCGKQYIGLATAFKERFRIHKVILIPVRVGVE